MNTIIKHQYSEAKNYSKPVVELPMPKDVFIKHARAGVDKLFRRSMTIYRNHCMYVNILEHYLNKYDIQEIVPDESFFNIMWDRIMEDGMLNGRQYSIHSRKKISRTARRIVNEYFYPKGLVQRKVLKKIVMRRYEKFLSLTKKSQEAIVWFEQNGKRVRAMPVYVDNGKAYVGDDTVIRTIHLITNKELLPVSKDGKIEHALRFLRIVGKEGFELVTDADVKKLEEYCVQRNVKQKEDYLAHVATFFINIHSGGFIKQNYFSKVSLKMNGGATKKDFISPEGIAKFRDLSSVDFNNKIEVRDRLIVLLAYDLALRLNEFLSLELSDIKKDPDGEWYAIIKADIQKGQDKDEEIMYFFFDETKKLLEIYLKKFRGQFNPITNHLIVSNNGGALNSQHCRVRFKALCEKMGVKTFYSKMPTPHVLRHSFATINIEPLGLSLPLYEMTERLRHVRVETTRKHYIHNNPYLQKLKHNIYRKKANKKSPQDILSDISLADLEHWLSDRLKIDGGTIRTIRKKHKQVLAEIKDDNSTDNGKIFIAEEEALKRIKELAIPVISLRQYASKQGFLKGDGSKKYGKGFLYREDFVDDLAQNWIHAKSLQKKMKLDHNAVYRILKREKWRVLKIGKGLYVNKQDCL